MSIVRTALRSTNGQEEKASSALVSGMGFGDRGTGALTVSDGRSGGRVVRTVVSAVRNRIVVVTIAAADAGVVRWPCVCAPAGTFRPSD